MSFHTSAAFFQHLPQRPPPWAFTISLLVVTFIFWFLWSNPMFSSGLQHCRGIYESHPQDQSGGEESKTYFHWFTLDTLKSWFLPTTSIFFLELFYTWFAVWKHWLSSKMLELNEFLCFSSQLHTRHFPGQLCVMCPCPHDTGCKLTELNVRSGWYTHSPYSKPNQEPIYTIILKISAVFSTKPSFEGAKLP